MRQYESRTATPIDGITRSRGRWGRSKQGQVWPDLFLDVNAANVAAGMTAGLWYAFGAVPLFLGATASLNLPPEVAAQWLSVTCATAGFGSIILTIAFRQPLAIGWTIPGLVFMASVGGQFSFPELMGGCLVAGLVVTLLGLFRVGERLMDWVPQSVVLGMFAGSCLGFVTGVFRQMENQPWVTGACLLTYLACWALGRPWLPPIGGAVIVGLGAALWSGELHPEALRWGIPAFSPVAPSFSLESILTLSLPLVAMVVGLGNVQGIGFLVSEGYRPPVRLLTMVVGLSTVLNALLGGHPSTIQRSGTAVVAGRGAGTIERRYVAALIASVWALLLAFTATTAQSMVNVLPPSVVSVVAGLAILSPMMDALKRSLDAERSAGAFVAFAISASSATILGLDSVFWALGAGWLVFQLLDRAPEAKQAQDDREGQTRETQKRTA